MTRSCSPPLIRLPEPSSKRTSILSVFDYRSRLARRLTFLVCPRKVSKRRALDIRPCTSLRCVPGAFAPSAFQGHAAKGRPWPIAALGFGILRRSTSCIHAVVAASLPLNPFHTDSAHPSDGVVGPCIFETAWSEMHSLGSRSLPIRRPSRDAVQQDSRQDAEKAPMDHGWSFGACLRNSIGAREVEHSETRMPERVSFAYFSLHEQRKVRRPSGRNPGAQNSSLQLVFNRLCQK